MDAFRFRFRDSRDNILRRAAGRDRDKHVAFVAERLYLAHEHAIEIVIVAGRRDHGAVDRQRERRKCPALLLIFADEFGGEVLAVGSRTAVAAIKSSTAMLAAEPPLPQTRSLWPLLKALKRSSAARSASGMIAFALA